MSDEKTFPVLLMRSLREMTLQRLKTKDVMIMYAIKAKPGIDGLGVCKAIGYNASSAAQSPLFRMVSQGYIEDRRLPEHNTHTYPRKLYLTDKGEEALRKVLEA